MLKNKHLLLTAGPTFEAIDPVRGITNHSSGKMGYALAEAAKALGAQVTLISGPVCLGEPENMMVKQVTSALQMYDQVHYVINNLQVDIFIGVAAVADYRPESAQTQKIKKSSDTLTLTLVKNPDIIASVAQLNKRRPFTVGFAAETENLLANATRKLHDKKLDMIVANNVSQAEIGFGSNQNQVTLITQNNTLKLDRQVKQHLANEILLHISQQIDETKHTSKNS